MIAWSRDTDELDDLRPEQPQDRADPTVEQPGGTGEVDDEAIEHGDDVGAGIPGLARDPSVGCKEPDRLPRCIDCDRHEMAELVVVRALIGLRRRRHGGARGLRRRIGDRQLRHDQRARPRRHAARA